MMAVVKANGYGHGAVNVAPDMIAAGKNKLIFQFYYCNYKLNKPQLCDFFFLIYNDTYKIQIVKNNE